MSHQEIRFTLNTLEDDREEVLQLFFVLYNPSIDAHMQYDVCTDRHKLFYALNISRCYQSAIRGHNLVSLGEREIKCSLASA